MKGRPEDSFLSEFSERFMDHVRQVCTFAKLIPGFKCLHHDDQVTLLKSCVFEVLLVRLAGLFDGQVRGNGHRRYGAGADNFRTWAKVFSHRLPPLCARATFSSPPSFLSHVVDTSSSSWHWQRALTAPRTLPTRPGGLQRLLSAPARVAPLFGRIARRNEQHFFSWSEATKEVHLEHSERYSGRVAPFTQLNDADTPP